MNLSGLLQIIRNQPAYQDFLTSLENESGQTLGLIRSARPYIISALAKDLNVPLLVITARMDRANNLAEQIVAWTPETRVLIFHEPNTLFYERGAWGPRSTRTRLQTLAEFQGFGPANGHPPVVITSARAIMQRTLPVDTMRDHTMALVSGEQIPGMSADHLLRKWLQIGYEPVNVVTAPGSFSRRGGIVDVFPVAAAHPVRIELWGDEITSLRTFDPATQRSLDSVSEIVVTPAREALPLLGPGAAARLKAWFEDGHKTHFAGEDLGGEIAAEQEKLLLEQAFDNLEFYLPWMDDPEVSLLDYAPGDTVVLVDGWQELVDAIDDLETQAISLREARQESGLIPGDMPLPYLTRDYLVDAIRQARSINLGNPPDAALAEQVMEGLGDLFLPGPRYAGELRVFLDHLKELSRPEQENVIVVSRQAERLAGLLQERVVGFRPTAGDDLVKMQSGEPVFVSGALAEGWVLSTENSRVHLLTDAEIFGWKRPEPRRRRQPRPVAPESFYADLKPGDYVVHVEHGIGQFVGLDKRVLGGVEREYLQVTYGGGNVLYVPIHQADRMSRYIGVDDSPPALSRLGTPDWGRIKERTQQAVEEIARDLLDLYASREAVVGHAFPPDTPWQHELEASFPYVETEDQLRALAEVKEDMEKPRPMDRLICGDVGYGKTEVALRAAFKAVMGGKQVAVLVPTTVLAQQHYDTFRLRLAAFPVEIEMLSRFRTRGQQDEVIDRLQGGTVDIVIGTHRLLSGDVAFHDLGLLIIDEEQRFGVTHKEQLKKMRTEVDVLTLTATPIPRTLWMSLTGVRDISVIDTAPEERLPVRTYVGRRNNDLIRDAVLRELDRGGQVFYVHNRVQTIYSEVARLKQVVPEATFAVGHGQMNEHELESVMARFGQGEIDVLVSTSIIEAGLDFPNANTLVVDRADRFGLSQLYQLRGRVGRSANRAFAYFFYPSRGAITPEARARLDTIDEYTDLGSGMNIAMRDLEIRGAGDILGLRQSGHISAVGFNLYTRMLAEAVRRVRSEREGGKPALEMGELPQEPITIDLPLPTYIPTDYVPDMALRIQLYRRMAELYTLEAVEEFGAELADRFGPLPPPVENLLFQLRVKQLAHHSRVSSIMAEGNQINVRLAGLAHVDRNSMQRQMGQGIRVSRTGIWLPRDLDDWRPLLIDVLSQLQSISPTET